MNNHEFRLLMTILLVPLLSSTVLASYKDAFTTCDKGICQYSSQQINYYDGGKFIPLHDYLKVYVNGSGVSVLTKEQYYYYEPTFFYDGFSRDVENIKTVVPSLKVVPSVIQTRMGYKFGYNVTGIPKGGKALMQKILFNLKGRIVSDGKIVNDFTDLDQFGSKIESKKVALLNLTDNLICDTNFCYIFLDPKTTLNGTSNVNDTYIRNCLANCGGSENDTNYGSSGSLNFGYQKIGSSEDFFRSLIKFNLTGLEGFGVINASIVLEAGISSSQRNSSLHIVNESWFDLNATWNNQPDFESDVFAEFNITTGGTKTILMSDTVSNWMDGIVENNGLLIKWVSEDRLGTALSSDGVSSVDSGGNGGPTLIVWYNSDFGFSTVESSGTNRTNTTVEFSTTWTGVTPDAWIFRHNQSGTMTNQTFNTTFATRVSSESLLIALTKGEVLAWGFCANSTTGAANCTSDQLLTVANTLPNQPTILFPDNNSNYSNINFNYSSFDIDNDSLTFHVFINGSVNSSSATNITNWVAADGFYSLLVEADDGVGNSSNSSEVLFRLDSAGPTFTGQSGNGSSAKYNVLAQFNITVSDPLLSHTIFSTNNSGVWTNNSAVDVYGLTTFLSVVNVTVNFTRAEVVGYRWFSNDSLANMTSSSIFAFSVANTVPVSPTLLDPDDTESFSVGYALFNYTSSDVDSDTITYYVYADTNTDPITLVSNSTNTSFNWTGLADDAYYWKVQADDSFGNSSNSSVRSFSISAVSPAITLKNIDNGAFHNFSSVSLGFIATDTEGIDTCVLYANFSGDWITNETLTSVTSGQHTNFTNVTLSQGIYKWNVFCNDTAGSGNLSSFNKTFGVDTANPSFSVSSPVADTTYNSLTVSLTISASDKFLDFCYYNLYFRDSSILKEANNNISCVGTTSLDTPYYSGGYRVNVFANDSASRVSTSEINFTTEAAATEAESTAGGGGGGNFELKYGFSNILRLGQRATLVFENISYPIQVPSIDEENMIVEMNIGDVSVRLGLGKTTPTEITDDGVPDIFLRVTDISVDQIAFFLELYREGANGDCVDNLWINSGKVSECEFSCDPVEGCNFKMVGDQVGDVRECGSRIMKGNVCIETSPIQYLISEEFFELEGVMKLNSLEQVITGVRDVKKGIPVSKKLTITNLDKKTIFVKITGEFIDELEEFSIEPGDIAEINLNIYPVNGRENGFLSVRFRKVEEVVFHSIMYKMKVVTCKSPGSKVGFQEECCSKSADLNMKCVPGTQRFSSISTVIGLLVFLSMATLLIITIVKGSDYLKKQRFFR